MDQLAEEKLFAISLQAPCRASWSKMKGDDFVRHCGACDKSVYNISKLSKRAAIDLINEKEGNLCVRFFERRDGTVVTQECASVLGRGEIREQFGILKLLAIMNAGLACVANILAPCFGPAVITIRNGGLPVIANPAARNGPKCPEPAPQDPL